MGTARRMPTVREHSAGGVVLRGDGDDRELAVIRPAGRPEGTWALPKGQVDRGEAPVDAALREVREETGLHCEVVGALDPVRYFYVRDGVRIAKTVEFWVMRPTAGEIGRIEDAMRVEVAEARWVPLADAARLLSYRGERAMLGALVAGA